MGGYMDDSYTITGMNGFGYSWMNIPNYYDAETGELVLIGGNKVEIKKSFSAASARL